MAASTEPPAPAATASVDGTGPKVAVAVAGAPALSEPGASAQVRLAVVPDAHASPSDSAQPANA